MKTQIEKILEKLTYKNNKIYIYIIYLKDNLEFLIKI